MNDDHEDLDPEDNLPSKGKQRSKVKQIVRFRRD